MRLGRGKPHGYSYPRLANEDIGKVGQWLLIFIGECAIGTLVALPRCFLAAGKLDLMRIDYERRSKNACLHHNEHF